MTASPPVRERRAQRGPRGEQQHQQCHHLLVTASASPSDAPMESNNKRRPRRPNKGPVVITTDSNELYEVPHHSQYTQIEINSIWFTQDEIDQTTKECQETVRCMQNEMPLADDCEEFTTRGLEYMTISGFDITTSSLDVVRLVLEEQAKLRQQGERGTPEMLASLVEGTSMHRLRIAHLAAMKDARAVYGDNFKTTVVGKPMRSRSLQSRRSNSRNTSPDDASGRLNATNYSGSGLVQRRQRRPRGLLGTERPRRSSDPVSRTVSEPSYDAVKATERKLSEPCATRAAREAIKGLSECDDPAVQATLRQMRARTVASKRSSSRSSTSSTTSSSFQIEAVAIEEPG